MAHWAEIDENNVVIRVTVGDNNDPAGDEGYSWLVNNLGGNWLKTSYNTRNGEHLLGGEPYRYNYASVNYVYVPEVDAFFEPKPYPSWLVDLENYYWKAPVPKPDSGMWEWNEEVGAWVEPDSL